MTEAQRLAEVAMKTMESDEDIIFMTCDDVHPMELFLFLRRVLEKKATNSLKLFPLPIDFIAYSLTEEASFKSFSVAGKVGSKILQKFVLEGIPQQHTDPETRTQEGRSYG